MQLKVLINKATLDLKKSGIPSAELDSQVILENVLNKDRVFTYTHPDLVIPFCQYAKFKRLINRRKTGEPLAYILGHKEFYGNDFIVNNNVLVPRPETETLVELGERYIKKLSYNNRLGISICDVGTGSGNLIISLALCCKEPNTYFSALDVSFKALAVAKKNALKYKQKIHFYQSDLFGNRLLRRKKFNILLANLPYVPHSKIKCNNPISFEPHAAIFADDNGTIIIKKFIVQSKDHLLPEGLILIELDPRNAQTIKNFAIKHYKGAEVSIIKDLSDQYRYLIIKKKA